MEPSSVTPLPSPSNSVKTTQPLPLGILSQTKYSLLCRHHGRTGAHNVTNDKFPRLLVPSRDILQHEVMTRQVGTFGTFVF